MEPSDIVARLRDYHATVLAAPPYYRELTRIAADEIERLRKELADSKRLLDKYQREAANKTRRENTND